MKNLKSTGWLLILLAVAGAFFLTACDPDELSRKIREGYQNYEPPVTQPIKKGRP